VLLLLGILLLVASLGFLYSALDFGPTKRSVMKERVQASQRQLVKDKDALSKSQLTAKNPELGLLRLFITRRGVVRLERQLSLAGKTPSKLPMVVLAKVIVPIILLLLGTTVAAGLGKPLAWVILGFAVVASYFVPEAVVNGRAVERQNKIMYDLPDILDQITISIEAGMGFESAMQRVGTNNRGPLGEEIIRTVQDMNLGMARKDSYLALAGRNDVEDLRRFTKSIVQAEEFGVPISQVVRIQADEMRDKRRQRARETAQKVPVKLLFPMLTCIMPVLFIVILTPAILSLGEVM